MEGGRDGCLHCGEEQSGDGQTYFADSGKHHDPAFLIWKPQKIW